ncbi:MAG: hypothetical protein K0S47_2030 [Herbinix sp.]|jgi:ABC-type glycerol-3-phosphate transport system substrate-binding protein|nr:hypothetical protein [Herbinix sp.]
MMKKKKRYKRIVFLLIAVFITVMAFAMSKNSVKSDQAVRSAILSQQYNMGSSGGDETILYEDYLDRLKDSAQIASLEEELMKTGSEYYESTLTQLEVSSDGSIKTGAEGSISYLFDVNTSGTYYIEVGYNPTADSNESILRNLYINGELPFSEAEGLIFNRMWKDEQKDFLMKTDVNQAFPQQLQDPEWTSTKLEAADKSIKGPFLFYFEKGNNIVTLESKSETLEISYIKLISANSLSNYESYLADREQEGALRVDGNDLENGVIMIQAEDTYYKSSATLLPVNDRTSPLTVPYHSSNIILNTIGGSSWDSAGLGITWKVAVPKSGLYRIATRFLQAENRDFYSIRELKINGEIPFEEAAELKFYYDSAFQTEYFGNEEQAYYFYLEEGDNLLTLTVSLGDLSYAVEQTSITVKNFNSLYRRLTAVMGSTPDAYRDYNILASVPDMEEILKTEYYRLNRVMESLGDRIDNSTKTREISKMMYQLEKLIKQPDKISRELITFNDNITAIGEWMLALGKQPLQLDYLLLCGVDYQLPKGDGNFFEKLWHNCKGFIGSFTNDYEIAGANAATKNKSIDVWIASSTRDQYDIAQRMVNNAFSESDFNVNLKMVGADTVMPATLTGNGPDVAIQLNYTMPSNFAYRNAGYDLTEFDDFDEVASQFSPGAMEFFEYEGGYYALPDQMSFPVMYYRTDILKELGLEVPNTWEELTALIPYLQAQNMQVYFVTTGHTVLGGYSSTSTKPINSVFLSMLYQNGEELYTDGGKKSNLEDMTSLLTFKYWTEFYTKQSFKRTMSVVTRFRTGEVPIIIEDYTYINAITAGAPEIEGDWAIAPIPGTKKSDGSIDRSTSCMVGAGMILKNMVTKNDTANESWEFLKWWTSEETQTEYAREHKVLLGDAANFPVANLEAIKKIAQDNENSATIEETLTWLRGTPQVPGGYITGRSVENAFLAVLDEKLNPVDTLYSQIRFINMELKNKRKEFGLAY